MMNLNKDMHKNLNLKLFIERFGGSGQDVRVFFAPGRINLIGEHTDYTGGYVFPAAINLGIWAYIRPRTDRIVRMQSMNFEQQIECELDSLRYEVSHDWANYVKGVLFYLLEEGLELTGADLLVEGNIPNGAGLSSSAVLEMVTAVAFNGLSQTNNGSDADAMQMIDLVQLAHKSENEFIGVKCGIMDQFAVGMGKKDHAIFLNCRTLEYERIPLKVEGYKLVITHTNKRRGLADSKYNERRSESEQGWESIRQNFPDKSELGQVTVEEWESVPDQVQVATVRQRVEHVVRENDRVKKARNALKEGDLQTFGQLMLASHESLRDLYEVTGAELDTLFDIARQVDGCIGTRMTGAGFGGCTVSIVRKEAVEAFKQIVEQQYTKQIGHEPTCFVCDISDGVKEITQEVHDSLWLS